MGHAGADVFVGGGREFGGCFPVGVYGGTGCVCGVGGRVVGEVGGGRADFCHLAGEGGEVGEFGDAGAVDGDEA